MTCIPKAKYKLKVPKCNDKQYGNVIGFFYLDFKNSNVLDSDKKIIGKFDVNQYENNKHLVVISLENKEIINAKFE